MSNARIFAVWLGRVVANAIAGGLAFAVVGAFCGGIVGVCFGALCYSFNVDVMWRSARLGAYVGLASGVFGVLIYAIAAFTATPGDLFSPFHSLKKRVCLGQIFGTFLSCASFIVFECGKAALQKITLAQALNSNDAIYFICIAPITMILGAIAGAIFKREPPKVATLNAK